MVPIESPPVSLDPDPKPLEGDVHGGLRNDVRERC
jgi:hypothetical protein